jgi:thiol-disulfide isomerase/thioredoxin
MPKSFARLALFVFLTGTLLTTPVFSRTTRPDKPASAPVVVSFGSECCGINRAAFDKLERFVKAFEKAHRVKIVSERRHWGKEGEFDVTFPLTGIEKSRQSLFRKELVELLKSERLVTVR